MSLAPGTHLGPYEILGSLGAGGMGEVYRARDTRLGREVAIKVLPESFSREPERVARFERESQLLASINHPNIAAIHDVAALDGVRFLVLELVEGETLAERLGRGALPVAEALEVARQVAEGLEAAHERGVIHRDLKPANVKVTPDGTVKLLDFGLAKDVQPRDPSLLSHSPTASVASTEAGVILGTVAYMSPEQARGKQVDKRADIWAFGCLLFECLTERPAFGGESLADVFAAIMKQEPDWQALPVEAPERIRELLYRCLEKDPRQRLRDIGDARIEIARAQAEPEARSARPPAPHALAWLWLAAAALGSALVSGLAVWMLVRAPQTPLSPVHLSLALPIGVTLSASVQPALAVSPDGRLVVFAGQKGGVVQLYARSLAEREAVPIGDTEGAHGPFFSPDGKWVGFFAEGKLKKASVEGRHSVTLCNAPNGFGGVWCADDTIIFSPAVSQGLHRVPASGGAPIQISNPDRTKGEISHRWPDVLPDGSLLFNAGTPGGFADAALAVLPAGGSVHRLLTQRGSFPRYVPSGHIVYGRSGALHAFPLDLRQLKPEGASIPVLEGARGALSSGASQFAVSPTGTLVYLPGGGTSADRDLVEVSRGGQPRVLPNARRPFSRISLSPDGRKIAVEFDTSNIDIWIYDLERQILSRFTTNPAPDNSPTWTPDGKAITFSAVRDGPRNLFQMPADGSAPERRLVQSDFFPLFSSWSHDGRHLVYSEIHPETGSDLWVMSQEGDRKPRPFIQTPFEETGPRFSPDGKWIAFESNQPGRYEVYVQAFPGPGARYQVSSDGGRRPVWRRDGGEIYYRSGTRVMALEVRTRPTFSTGIPRFLFDGPYEPDYDVSADGQKFYMVRSNQSAPGGQLNVVLNWFEELGRRLEKKQR